MSSHRHAPMLWCLTALIAAVGQVEARLDVSRSTLFGGTGVEDVKDLAVGTDGSVYLVGTTQSGDFPGAGAAATGVRHFR